MKGFSTLDYCCRRACVPNDQCGENVIGCRSSEDCLPGFDNCLPLVFLLSSSCLGLKNPLRAAVHDRSGSTLLRGRGRVLRWARPVQQAARGVIRQSINTPPIFSLGLLSLVAIIVAQMFAGVWRLHQLHQLGRLLQLRVPAGFPQLGGEPRLLGHRRVRSETTLEHHPDPQCAEFWERFSKEQFLVPT